MRKIVRKNQIQYDQIKIQIMHCLWLSSSVHDLSPHGPFAFNCVCPSGYPMPLMFRSTDQLTCSSLSLSLLQSLHAVLSWHPTLWGYHGIPSAEAPNILGILDVRPGTLGVLCLSVCVCVCVCVWEREREREIRDFRAEIGDEFTLWNFFCSNFTLFAVPRLSNSHLRGAEKIHSEFTHVRSQRTPYFSLHCSQMVRQVIEEPKTNDRMYGCTVLLLIKESKNTKNYLK